MYIIIHELGHFIYFKRALKRDVMIQFGKHMGKYRLFTGQEKDYKGLTKDELIGVYSTGVTTGIIFLFLMMAIRQDHALYILPLVVFGGWQSDLRKIKALNS